jgi:hemerythrin
MSIVWSDELNTGIAEIDEQHRRIVDFINRLKEAQEQQNPELVAEVVSACAGYTATHFSFEESLQHEAGYEFLAVHRTVHAMFTKRISEYQRRLKAGDDVAEELHDMLARWLINHIKLDDADYVGAVKMHQASLLKQSKQKGGKGFISRLLG